MNKQNVLLKIKDTFFDLELNGFELPASILIGPLASKIALGNPTDKLKIKVFNGPRRITRKYLTKEIYSFEHEEAVISIHRDSQETVIYWLNPDVKRIKHYLVHAITPLFVMGGHSPASLVLHASCVIIDGKASLFLAPSEGGKSTLSNMLAKKGNLKLADDLVLIKQTPKGYYAYDLLDLQNDAYARIKNLFFIRKSNSFSLKDISFVKAVELAAAQFDFPYRLISQKQVLSQHFHFLQDLIKAVPTRILSFSLNSDININ